MKSVYADATAVLRLVLAQPGARMPTGRSAVLVSSELVEVETHRSLDRARLKGFLDELTFARKLEELTTLLATFHLLPLDRDMLELAKSSFPVGVSAMNALHVGTAQVIARDTGQLEFWTHAPEQAAAAAIRGLAVRGVASRA